MSFCSNFFWGQVHNLLSLQEGEIQIVPVSDAELRYCLYRLIENLEAKNLDRMVLESDPGSDERINNHQKTLKTILNHNKLKAEMLVEPVRLWVDSESDTTATQQ